MLLFYKSGTRSIEPLLWRGWGGRGSVSPYPSKDDAKVQHFYAFCCA